MSAERRLTDHDYELLSTYLDGELSDSERSALETRLENEPALRRELDALRQTVTLVNQLPTLKAPRSFTLDARMIRPARLLILPTTAAFSALSAAAAVLLLVLGGYVLFSQNLLSAPPGEPQAAQQIANQPTSQLTVVDNADLSLQAAAPSATAKLTQTPTQAPSPLPASPQAIELFDTQPEESQESANAAASVAQPTPTIAPPAMADELEASVPSDGFAEEAAQGGAQAGEAQQSAPAPAAVPQSTSAPNPTALAYAATNEITTGALRETDDQLDQTATSLSAGLDTEQAAITVTPVLSRAAEPTSQALTPTLSPTVTAEALAGRQRFDGEQTSLAGVLLAAGIALLLVSAATTLVRARRR